MSEQTSPIVKRSLASWIFSGNLKLQILLVFVVLATVLARLLPLEMQKRIIDEAIERKDLRLLVVYCGVYLAAFIAASGLKFLINVVQTVISQRTLAQMRKELFAHILHLPYPVFRDTRSGLVVSALLTELASAADFIGMAVAIPMTNLMTLLAFAGYLVWLNPLLAAVSFSIYPVVVLLVPRLQRRVDRYNSQRVDASRDLSGKIGETVDGIHEVKINGAYDIENERFGKLADRLKRVRIRWKFYRFGVKVINSLFTNFSRFLIFSLGGTMALQGNLALGSLVAFLSAQEKLYDPWKELLDFYQALRTARVVYHRTMDRFDTATEPFYGPEDGKIRRLDGALDVEGLSYVTPEGKPLLRDVSFSLKAGEHMALAGFSGSGKSTLAHCLVRLIANSGGSIRLDGRPMPDLTPRELVANVGFVSQAPLAFSGTLADNLVYACPADEKSAQPSRSACIEVLQQAGLYRDVLNMGFRQTLPNESHASLKKEILLIRRRFRSRFGEELDGNIEPFAKDRYLEHSSVADNIRFGCPCDDRFDDEHIANRKVFRDVLHRTGLFQALIEMGESLAEQIMDAFQSMPMRAEAARSVPLDAEEMEAYGGLIDGRRSGARSRLSKKDRQMLLTLSLRFVPARHRMLEMSEELRRLILLGRIAFRAAVGETAPDSVVFFDKEVYAEGLPILENIIFGRLDGDDEHVQDRVYRAVNRLLVEEEFLEEIAELGMAYDVGSGGENLSGGQRQKLAIARALLKKPSILILDEATASLDNRSQALVQDMLESQYRGSCTLVSVVHRLDLIENYDRIGVMKDGRLAEMGSYGELMEKEGLFAKLAGGRG